EDRVRGLFLRVAERGERVLLAVRIRAPARERVVGPVREPERVHDDEAWHGRTLLQRLTAGGRRAACSPRRRSPGPSRATCDPRRAAAGASGSGTATARGGD